LPVCFVVFYFFPDLTPLPDPEPACRPILLPLWITALSLIPYGLSEEVKDELAAWELQTDLDSFIALTILIDGRLRERRREKRSD
jgi:hypothetical protein